MYTHQTARILLSFFLILGVFSSLALSPVQADTSSVVTLSPVITAKLDAFIVKVQALRAKYPSDTDWGMFIDKLSGKIIALKPRYIENPLILAVLNRLNSGVTGLKNTTASASSVDNEDLCAKEGLDNINETNFNPDRDVFDCHPTGSQSWNPSWCHYRMNAGESYSFPFTSTYGSPMSNGNFLVRFSGDEYSLNGSVGPMQVISISERKCDFTKPIIGNQLTWVSALFDPKFSDPNAPRPIGYSHYLVPGKRYYYNIRWAKRSDFSDNGVALDKQYAWLGGAFNSKGDTCLWKILSGDGGVQKMRDDCAINPDFGDMPGLPKFSPAKAAEQERIRQSELAAGTANQVGPFPPATPPACVNKAGGPLNTYGDAWCSTKTKPDGTKYTRSINDCLGYCE